MQVSDRFPQKPANDDLYFILSEHRRRAVILLLAAAPQHTLSLESIAAMIYSLETGADLDQVHGTASKSIKTNLKRSHKSRLTESQIINWEGDMLSPGPRFGEALSAVAPIGTWISPDPSKE